MRNFVFISVYLDLVAWNFGHEQDLDTAFLSFIYTNQCDAPFSFPIKTITTKICKSVVRCTPELTIMRDKVQLLNELFINKNCDEVICILKL